MTVIVDTGVFFAFYSLKDRYHLDSLALIVHLIEGKWGRAFITNHILDETLNILKYKLSYKTANAFIEVFIDRDLIKVLYTDREIEEKALRIFKENISRKGFSYTDAITVAVIREYGINYLLTYDERSFTGLVENIVGIDYWSTLTREEQNRILKLVEKLT